jgi:tetratricopeptide (TPR) repeat protein
VNAHTAPAALLDELRSELSGAAADPDRLVDLAARFIPAAVRRDADPDLPADAASVLGRSLWRAATAGRIKAWLLLADCIGPHRHSAPWRWRDLIGVWPSRYAFGDPPTEPVGALLRCLDEAARLGDRTAALRFADASRFGSRAALEAAREHVAPLLGSDPDGRARYLFGLLLYHLGDRRASLTWHEQAAAAGNADAMFELYCYYSTGIAVDVDGPAADRWLTEAAARRHPRALFNLGAFAVEEGRYAEAVEHYERAAAAGSERALENLFVMHLLGDGIEPDPERAEYWMHRAEEAGVDVPAVLEGLGLDPTITLRRRGLEPAN